MTIAISENQLNDMDDLYRTPASRRLFEKETGTPPRPFNFDDDPDGCVRYTERFWGWASARYHMPEAAVSA